MSADVGHQPPAKSSECPICESPIARVHLADPFPCPTCDHWLYVPRYYSYFWSFVALGVTVASCSALGARGPILLLASVVAYYPVLFIMSFWMRHFAPPRLRPCDRPRRERQNP